MERKYVIPWIGTRITIGDTPYQAEPLIYNGREQTLILQNFDDTAMIITGNAGINADEYVATATPDGNHQWEDGTTTPREIRWRIVKKQVAVPKISNITFPYKKGVTRSPDIEPYNTLEIRASGIAAEKAGTHKVTFALINPENTELADDSAEPLSERAVAENTGDRSRLWYITKTVVNEPKVTVEILYYVKGVKQGPTIEIFDTNLISMYDNEKINAGKYELKFSLTDRENYEWNTTGNSEDRKFPWSIERQQIAMPVISDTTLTFKKNTVQSPSIGEYDTNAIIITGASGTMAGTHTMLLKLTDTSNTEWTDSTVIDKAVEWYIITNQVHVPEVTDRNKTFQVESLRTDGKFVGKMWSPTIEIFDTDTITATGYTASDVGTHTVTFKLNYPNGMEWEGGDNTDKHEDWYIAKQRIAIPRVTDTSKVYQRGIWQSSTITNFDADYMTKSGDSGTFCSDYTVVFSLKDANNTEWENGSIDAKRFDWKIVKAQVEVSNVTNTEVAYVRNTLREPSIEEFDTDIIKVAGHLASEAGTHEVVFSLNDKQNYSWTDTSISDKKVPWKMTCDQVDIPDVANTHLEYNGEWRQPRIGTYDASLISVKLDSQSDVGNYAVTFSLKSNNYQWTDSTTADKSVPWDIYKLKLPKPYAEQTEFPYSDKESALEVRNYVEKYMAETGTTSAQKTGSYTATYTLDSTKNTCWCDNTVAPVNIPWRIGAKLIPKPYASGTTIFIFEKDKYWEIDVKNYDEEYMVESGTKRETEVGNYSVKYTLKDTDSTKWCDTTVIPVTIPWTIQSKALDEEEFYQRQPYPIYNGSTHEADIVNYDSKLHALTGATTGVNAGSYTATVSPQEGYTWVNSGVEGKKVPWVILPATVDVPKVTDREKVYTGSVMSPTITYANERDKSLINVVGDKKTAVGDYSVEFTLKDTKNYKFGAGETSVPWKITKMKVPRPKVADIELIYNGEAQSPTITINSDYKNLIKVEGNKATDAGNYELKFTLLNSNMEWGD